MIRCGIENKEAYVKLLSGKRLGLITNPTGVDHLLTPTIDLLHQAFDLKILFGPEHGVRGNLEAGMHVEDQKDEKTGLTVYSLYGANRAPSEAMLKDIDILLFDIQDVGARFYTYLWTMVYAMEACKKHHKPFVVFDRPNPVGGTEVEGWMLHPDLRSFVGYMQIPQRYGLTIGELALMANDMLEIGCDLTVVPMIGYRRHMHYRDTGLPWILPSPNIPTPETAFVYLATCLFEGTNLSEGRGTTKPFSMIGAPWFQSDEMTRRMNDMKLDGILFRPCAFTPFQSKHQGILCHGIELIVTDPHVFQPVKTGLLLLEWVQSMHDAFSFLPPYKEGRPPMIDLLTGSSDIRLKTHNIHSMLNRMDIERTRFEQMNKRYHLYE